MSLINKSFVDKNKYNIKCPYNMKPKGIAIHNTYNDASALNETTYMKNNNNQVSFHIAVDDKEAIQVIPFDRNAWAAGDGSKGDGNRNYIHLEICYSKSGGEKFKKAEILASKVVVEIINTFGFTIDNIKAHREFSGKNCPHRTNMNEFKKLIEKEVNNSTKKHYTNAVLYNDDVDKVAAEIIGWNKKDCIVKDIDDHIKWEATNLFVIGGPAEIKLKNKYPDENYTSIKGKDRYDTIRKSLEFVGK